MHRRGAIDRLLTLGLSARAEARLRLHLRGCDACRAYHDDQRRLLRALAGDVSRPTASELDALIARSLDAAGARPLQPQSSSLSWMDGLLLHPLRSLAVLVAGAGVVAMLVVLQVQQGSRGPGPSGERVAAHLTAGRGVSSDSHAVVDGAELLEGREIEVGRTGLAELSIERGGQLRLFPGTRLVLGPRGEVVELRAGRVWCEVDRGRGAFEVRTDGATARVLGTSFVVEREEQGDTEVRVMGGTVEVEDHRKGGRVLVTAGQKSRVHAGAPPSAVDRYREEDDRDAWNDLLRELGRKLRRVGKLLDRLLEK